MRITERIQRWLDRREEDRLLRKFGGTQTCPWCARIMQGSEDTTCDDSAPFETAFTCGHCGGQSFWRWEVGFIFLAAGAPPPRPPISPHAIYMTPENRALAKVEFQDAD